MSTAHPKHKHAESVSVKKESDKKKRDKSSAQSKSRVSQNKSQASLLETKIEALEKSLAQEEEKYMRLVAEFENFKKRNVQERLQFLETANESVLRDMLPILDDLERGLVTAKKQNLEAALLEGFELVWHKFTRSLKNQGVEEISAPKGHAFNDEKHEAIAQVSTTEKNMDGKIVQVIEKGYQMKNKVLRFAKVQIAKHE